MENYSIDNSNEVTTSIINALRRERRDKDNLWVTDIGKCKRYVWYSWQNLPITEKIDEVILKLNLGNFIHDGLTKTLKQTTEFSVLKEEWSEISEGLPFGMRGRLDVLIMKTGQGEIYPLDWKSVMNFKYQISFPKMRDVYQLQLYIEGLIKFYPEIKRGKIIYVDKAGAQKPVEVWVERNPKILDMAKQYHCLKDQKEPPDILEREFNLLDRGTTIYLMPNWECTYCDYSETCKPNVSKNLVARVENGELKIRPQFKQDADLIIAFYDSQKYGGM